MIFEHVSPYLQQIFTMNNRASNVSGLHVESKLHSKNISAVVRQNTVVSWRSSIQVIAP